MQSEYDRLQFDQEPHTFEEADAILEIQMPTYLNSMRLKAASMGTSDASLNDCRTSIRVRMTQQQIMEIGTESPITVRGKIISVGEVLGFSMNIDSIN